MARTEKKFGQVQDPAANINNEIVASSLNRRNVVINITARSSANVSITTFTAAPSYTASGVAIDPSDIKYQKNNVTGRSTEYNYIKGMSVFPGTNSALVFHGTAASTNIGDNMAVSWVELDPTSSDDLIQSPPYSTVNAFGAGSIHNLISFYEFALGNIGVASPYQTSTVNDGRTVYSSPFKMLNTYAGVVISGSTGTAMAGTTTVATTINVSRGTSAWDTSNISTSVITSGSKRLHSISVVSSTTTNKQAVIANSSLITLTYATSALSPMDVFIASSTSTATSGDITWDKVSWPASAGGTINNVLSGKEAFVTMDYNESRDVYAISHANITNTIGSDNSRYWSTPSTATSFPGERAPAGFRIATVTATAASPFPYRFMYSSNQFPSAPSGVNVPQISQIRGPQVVSLKFSPDGNHLAAMYNQDYSGTGNTFSVAVIYSVDSAGNWNHTYSSGSSILYRGGNQESMLWLPDSSGIVIISGDSVFDTSRYVQFWCPIKGKIGYVHSSSTVKRGISRYQKSPRITSAFSIGTSTQSVDGVTRSSILDQTPGAVISANIITSATRPGRLVYCTMERSSSNAYDAYKTQLKYIDLETVAVIGDSGSSAPGYINTVAQDIYMEPGKTVQISNIVLEAGESLYIESDTGDAIDATAYGVEIS